MRFPCIVPLSVALLALTAPAIAADKVIDITSRGQKVRALLVMPNGAPIGGVVLLAGGDGRLDLGANGAIGWGAGNQLVRTRAAYAAAGYVALVPDIAPDLKLPNDAVVSGYRGADKNAADIGAAVAYLRAIKSPVVVIGTSRGSISAANAAVRLTGMQRPDGLVLSSAYLGANPKDFTVQKLAGGDPKRLNLPLLIVEHRADACADTAPSAVEPFRAWFEQGGRKLDVIWMEGGSPPKGDPCEYQAAHGFAGLDDQVVAGTVGWIKAQALGH